MDDTRSQSELQSTRDSHSAPQVIHTGIHLSVPVHSESDDSVLSSTSPVSPRLLHSRISNNRNTLNSSLRTHAGSEIRRQHSVNSNLSSENSMDSVNSVNSDGNSESSQLIATQESTSKSDSSSDLSIPDSPSVSSHKSEEPLETSTTECAICLELVDQPPYAILSNCLHRFHESCIQEWFTKKGEPICPCCNGESPVRIVIPDKNLAAYLTEFDPESNNHKKSYILTRNEDNNLRSSIRMPGVNSRQHRYSSRDNRVYPVLRIPNRSVAPLPPLPPNQSSVPELYPSPVIQPRHSGCCTIS